MHKRIVINSNISETRIALLEDGRLTEFNIERDSKQGIFGNIYKGIVNRVLPGINAAFIDIGLNRTAFLFGGDVIDPNISYTPYQSDEDSDDKRPVNIPQSIEQVLRDGQEIVVQVSKEALGSKGPRVSMFLTIPGRFLVLMPYFAHIGISRRIEDVSERDRLKSIAKEILPEGMGVIIRTAAVGIEKDALEEDVRALLKDWQIIAQKIHLASPPEVLYQDIDLTKRVTRDLFSEGLDEIIVDSEIVYNSLSKFISDYVPTALSKLKLYSEPVPIFDVFGIEIDLARALAKRVELPNGGCIVIDQTEALTTFDVNTGKFVGHLNAQETILRTNLESIDAIVEQLRLRNIGGIIVIDFIDMESLDHRELVYQKFMESLKKDRARCNVLKISELGLIQMTRKRTAPSLEQQLMHQCPHCQGTSKVRRIETEAHDLLREVVRYSNQTKQRFVKVSARQDLQKYILEKTKDLLDQIKLKYKLEVAFVDSPTTAEMLREPSYEVGVDP